MFESENPIWSMVRIPGFHPGGPGLIPSSFFAASMLCAIVSSLCVWVIFVCFFVWEAYFVSMSLTKKIDDLI